MSNYETFITSKVKLAQQHGFEVEDHELPACLYPHQRDAARWGLRRGRALLGMKFGLGKTLTQLAMLQVIQRREAGRVLVICPLGVRHQFTEEDGPRLGIRLAYVRNEAEALAADTPFLITNYERVRDGGFSAPFLAELAAVSLDEGSILRSLGNLTTQEFHRLFAQTKYRFVATATPSPNAYTELAQYAHFLGVMDAGQILQRWFKRDSTKAHNAQLHPQHEDEFWQFIASWALLLTVPSDLGYSDEGYSLPKLRVHWHCISTAGPDAAATEKDGQLVAFASVSHSLSLAAAEKRRSVPARVTKMLEIVTASAPGSWLLWHHLERERVAIEAALPTARTVYGSQDLDERESLVLGFTRGEYEVLATKPSIAGSGCNFQRHCHRNIFVGINYEFEDFIQAIHRTHRFQQTREVEVHILYTEAEAPIRRALEAKWAQHETLMERMRELIQAHGLNHGDELRGLNRKMGVERREVRGEHFHLVNNDCVEETRQMAENSVHLIHTSIPFSKQFEYSANYCDFGHNESNDAFFKQLGYLIPELFRVLKPGRVAAIHVKDLIEFGNVTGLGFPTVYEFSDDTVRAFKAGGFAYCGRITVATDVVKENNQTYRLAYNQKLKDASKMSCGVNEYVLLFRKPPSDRSDGYADERIVNSAASYSLARWQVDAAGFWQSSGNRLLTAAELQNLDHAGVLQYWKVASAESIYAHQAHVALCEQLAEANRLPKTFALLAPQSKTSAVWSDITYVKTLNTRQTQRRQQNHVCPLPIDIVDRSIENWSAPGEVVYDPFAGIGTVPSRAVRLGRIGKGTELNAAYFDDGVRYCREAEYQVATPTLFDFVFQNAGQEAQAA